MTDSNLSREQMLQILDSIDHEIYVLDDKKVIRYINPASLRHYGMLSEEMIGKRHEEMERERWVPSIIPRVFSTKETQFVRQISYLGSKLDTAAVPVLDENGEIRLVVAVSQENIERFHRASSVTAEMNQGVSASQRQNVKDSQMVAESLQMKRLLKEAGRVAKTDVSVFIQGETGVGKSVLAEYIHAQSPRKDKKFLSVNCAAFQESLLESELFGYVPHAFTGASPKGKKGLLEIADGGTLFLDEIGELPLALQTKLLSVIESKEFIPLGATKAQNVDIRILAATNRDLKKQIEEKTFRADLYWRLCSIEIEIPPLSQRAEDIRALSLLYLKKYNAQYDMNCEITPMAMAELMNCPWPGNVRQLKNAIEKLVLLSDGEKITEEDVKVLNGAAKTPGATSMSYREKVDDYAAKLVKEAYEEAPSSRGVAKLLGVSQTKANTLIREYLLPQK